ncbi:MAG: c-type cytochrome [Anaerolineae bacterium]|nr:c-type cytochrome [Anaerolineae bacterium]
MAAQTASDQRTHPRLPASVQIERLVVAISLVGLAITGAAQHFSGEPWARVVFVLGGGVESVRILHRFFALLFIAEAIYHVLTGAYRWLVRGIRPILLPGVSDLASLIRQVAANLGLRRSDAPDYRFALKLEYLVVVVGAVVLIVTGLALWNPIAVTSVLPGETIPIARSVHADHALLTIGLLILSRLAILLLWRPSRAAVYAESFAGAKPASESRRRLFLPIALALAVLLGGGLILFLTSEQTAITTVPRQQAVIFAPQALPESGDAHVGAALWETLRCAFCHGADGTGGLKGEPALRLRDDLTFEAFYQRVRIGKDDMPAFTREELPDGYLVHLWAWLTQ